MQLAASAHEVDPPPHGAEGGVRLALEIDVPALLAALELPHVLAVFGPGHGHLHYRLSWPPPARVTFSNHELSRVRSAPLSDGQVLPQVRRGGGRCAARRMAGRL